MGKKCLECNRQSTYNFPEKNNVIYCKEHKKEGMVNVKDKKCLKCSVLPSFNFPGETSYIYCKEHKKEGMVNVRKKICLECEKIPHYNFPGEKSAIYCRKHKKEGMLFLYKKTCLKCSKHPNYNFQGKKTGIYCNEHKEEGMINIFSQKCLECDTIPSYNFLGKKPAIYCSKHKKNGMINIKIKLCLECSKQPSFNFPGEKMPLYCSNHSKPNMKNVVDKRCVSEYCETRANKYYNNYCCYCFTNLFPLHPKTKTARKKNKEIAVKNWLYENGQDDFLHDRPIYLGDCNSPRRVDLYKYIGDKHILCVEIDEHQHKSYNKEDEVKRYNELYKIGYHMIFIRYNPDKYKDKDNRVRQPFFETRMNVLVSCIENWTKKIFNEKCKDELLYIEYLYYDGYQCLNL